ncbi:MAG: indole-3-glycerol-phosphate synthase [Phycisphaerales bacterium JB058]
MGSILDEIVETKKREVAERKSLRSLAELERAAADADEPRGFVRSLTAPLGDLKAAIIAEVKRKSPSAGWIREEYRPGADGSDAFGPEDIARRYHQAGARAISCLTDEPYFAGRLAFLERVRGAVPLPVLRKDFMVDPWQIAESRAAGADAVLLIAECLSDEQIADLLSRSLDLGMDVLVESHDRKNLLRCVRLTRDCPAGRVLLGINNRDLRIMKTDLDHTLRMTADVPDPGLLVSESGIRTAADLELLGGAGVRKALVGEHLMAQTDPGAALSELLGV